MSKFVLTTSRNIGGVQYPKGHDISNQPKNLINALVGRKVAAKVVPAKKPNVDADVAQDDANGKR